MYHETAYFASDYQTEIESLSNPAKMAQQGKIVQFDFVGPVSTIAFSFGSSEMLTDRFRDPLPGRDCGKDRRRASCGTGEEIDHDRPT